MVELQEIFNVHYGVNLELNKLTEDPNGINFVSRTAKNNGVSARVLRIQKVKPIPAGTITVAGGGSVLETFLQNEPYYSGRDLYYLVSKKEMSVAQKLYYCACIRANKYRYSYGRQANRTLRQLLVPALHEIPAWVETVDLNPFRGAEEPTFDELLALPVVNELKRLDEIFNIQNGIAATKLVEFDKPTSNSVVYIRPASTQIRTLRSFIDKDSIEKKHIFPKHTLFTSTNGEGSHTYSYVSTCEIAANSDVAVLTPKQDDMPMEVKLYYAKCITANRYLFSYGRKPKGEKLKSLKLPYFADEADFDYIKKFIHGLPFSSSL
ncbi:MAG: restriction endonuclease subunit S [Neisseria sp.]|nr:restriction endonuclease subunit S [Neisseria sp.]